MILEEKISRLKLSKIRGIGPQKFLSIAEYFQGNTTQIWSLSNNDLKILLGQKVSEVFNQFKKDFDLENYMDDLAKRGIHFTVYGDDEYPSNLKNIYDFPVVLFYKGSIKQELLNNSLGVVGTRKNTIYGENIAKSIIKELVNENISIVSGLASGIDTITHNSALTSGGYTVAVIPTSPDLPVPSSNRRLYEKILESNGLIVSENDLYDRNIPVGMFPRRNRIIAGMTLGTLVIEADERSGALITANNAFDNGRLVFAVPGDIFNNRSKGTNKLIKENKAKLIENSGDILVELGIESEMKKTDYKPKNELESKIINTVLEKDLTINEISRELNIEVSKINSCISFMEIEGAINKDNNGFIKFMI